MTWEKWVLLAILALLLLSQAGEKDRAAIFSMLLILIMGTLVVFA